MDLVTQLTNSNSAIRFLEKIYWPHGSQCPHCREATKLQTLGGKTADGTWKCYRCRRKFNIRSIGYFRKSHIPIHIHLRGLYLLSINAGQIKASVLSYILGISRKSSLELRSRYLAFLAKNPNIPGETVDIRVLIDFHEEIDDRPLEPLQPGYLKFRTAIINADTTNSDIRFMELLYHMLESGDRNANTELPESEIEQMEFLFDRQIDFK